VSLSLSNCKSGKPQMSKEDVAGTYLMCLFKEGILSKQLSRLGNVPRTSSKDLHVVGALLRSMVGFLLCEPISRVLPVQTGSNHGMEPTRQAARLQAGVCAGHGTELASC
jgi:hypothetical protein